MLIFCLLSCAFPSFSPFLRPKLQDGQLFSQHRKPPWWAGSVHCLPASSPLQREWHQHFVSAAVRHQEGVFLQHHSLSLPQQDHGQEGDGELFILVTFFFLFFFNCLYVFVSVLLCRSHTFCPYTSSAAFLSSLCSLLLSSFWFPSTFIVFFWGVFMCVCYPQDEDLEAQVSFLQGQINDLEAMSKYCAKMMNTHICEYNRWSNLHVHFQHLKH